MKKLVSLVLAIIIILSLCGCGNNTSGSASKSGPVVLIAADSTSRGSAGQMFFEYVAKRCDELSGGAVTLDYHPNAELGGDSDLLRQMQTNDIQMVVCQTAPMVSFVPEMAVFDLPMVFSRYDGDTIDSVLNGDNAFTEAISSAYESAGLHHLGFLQNATYRLTTANRDLSTLQDFKGLQIRTMENRNHMAFWSAIGAESTPLAWPEVYIALRNGTIDAEENAADTCVGANFQEVQKYLACTNHILYCNQICISSQAWEALDEGSRAVITQAVSDAIGYMRPRLRQIDLDNKEKLRQGGMTIIEYDNGFFDSILSLDGVKALYSQINADVNGLGDLLCESLEASK